MSKTCFARTLIASTLVIMPAAVAAQTSPASDDEETSSTEVDDTNEEADDEQSPPDEQTEPAGEETPEDEDEAESEQAPAEQQEGQSSPQQQGEADSQSEEDPESESTADEQDEADSREVQPPPDQSDQQPEGAPEESDGDESPISGLAGSDDDDEEGFEPVADIDETELQEITPADVYPFLEWDGMFRVRTDAAVNFDLGTAGTSAILPPAENNLPPDEHANEQNGLLWSTNMNFRLDPTIHLTENLRIHVEAALLENVVFGSLSDQRLTRPGTDPFYRPDPSRTVFQANQIPPREREWFENSVNINEVWGEIDTFLGSLRAGRMDNHWGLGIHANSGDCVDCNYGDHVDRIEFLTKPLGIYASASIDFPDQGVTTQTPDQIDDQAYDVAQIDDARQYTFSLFRQPRSDKDEQIRQQKLKDDQVPVLDGGARFTLRNQEGLSVPAAETTERSFNLVYRGLSLYVPDVWVQFKYAPNPETYVRLALEGVGVFGDIDNTTRSPVGGDDTGVNCFDEGDRSDNPDVCTSQDGESTDSGISQLGAAFESELYFGGPVRFGLNAGYASGGSSPNWGYATPGEGESVGLPNLDFYRFDPNYHVDLILFREVIGSVTNAYYANPYAQARFFESADQRMEVQLDAIASRVADPQGTPAQDGNWLGFELDAAVRYLRIDQFQAELEGGVLFPFEPLEARIDNAKLTRPPGTTGETFQENIEPSIPWTIQSNLVWQF